MLQFFHKERLKRKCNKLLARHQYDQALEHATNAAQQFPQDPHFMIYSVWALLERKDFPNAQEKVEQALQKFAGHQVLINLKGEIEFKLGHLDAALQSLEEVYREAPDNLHTSYILGQIYAAKGDLDQSSKYFENILQYDPKLLQVRLLAMSERYIYEMNQKQQ